MNRFRAHPIQFNENVYIGADGISDNIQILRVGKFFHDGQMIDITKSDLKSMVKNFSDKIRGVDLMLDFSHDSEKEAAAWFQELYLSEDDTELWAKVDWTEDGSDSVRKKKFRYVSADFTFSYEDNETLKKHGPTLFGAGLTNRPVIKNMVPTILSEYSHDKPKDSKMNFEEEFKKEAEKNKKLQAELADMKKKLAEDGNKDREDKLAEREAAVKLSEEKAIKDEKDSKKKGEFDTMLSEGKAVEAQRVSFMEDNMAEFVKNAPKAGEINLSEIGNGGTGGKKNEFEDSETPAQDEVISLAEKKVVDEKIDINAAISNVLSENKELNEKYMKESEA